LLDFKNANKYFDSDVFYKSLDKLPTYSLLIAVYHEKDVIGNLVKSLGKLVWAKNKLDIIFLCEEDDVETLAQIQKHSACLHFRTIILPKGEIKTKPRALQAGLEYVRGKYVGVYDAEDRPHPEQLLEAYNAFLKGDEKLAVVQAPLVPWNHRENMISALFTIDYATWYRVIIPFYAKFFKVFPLGGTSNHFKVSILKEVGGWDPANLTEDADLGMRFALFGYSAGNIYLPTEEEAPPRLSVWLRQRTRWIQGHLQTLDVAAQNFRIGFKKTRRSEYFSIIFALASGPFYGALRFPALVLLFLNPHNQNVMWVFLVFEALIAIKAILRDGRFILLGQLILLPFYWFVQTIALYRATIRVFTKPLIWEKTMHGKCARLQFNLFKCRITTLYKDN
jgi:cellulose synthase/poly-beta-1,6-N-acetylglucosamine synthase-like glycosyltransferase